MTGLERLLQWHSMRGGISTQEATATGNPATFSTTLVRPLVSCVANFAPVQAGSGDPSPENVRPISGWDGLTVYHSGADVSRQESFNTSWESQAGDVYGGNIDFVSGTLTKTRVYIEFDGSADESWNMETPSSPNFYILISDAKKNQYSTINCNCATPADYLQVGKCKISSSGNFNIKIGELIDVFNVSNFRAWLSDHPIQVTYEIVNPQVYQLSPIQIIAMTGTNNIWSDANGNLTVKYLMKGA